MHGIRAVLKGSLNKRAGNMWTLIAYEMYKYRKTSNWRVDPSKFQSFRQTTRQIEGTRLIFDQKFDKRFKQTLSGVRDTISRNFDRKLDDSSIRGALQIEVLR
jgi:hypothetical protein